MKLLVLGASGGVGRQVVQQALDRGHAVTALSRASSSYRPPDAADDVRAEVLDPATLPSLVPGHDAVLSALGHRRASIFPYAPLRSPADLNTRVATLLIPVLQSEGIDRVMVVSAAGVGDSRGAVPRSFRFLIRTSTIGKAYADLETMEAHYAASSLDWCAVRPVTLTDGALTGDARIVDGVGLTSFISRADVADWMLAHLESETPRTPLLG